jgi:hypothetical protein
MFLVLSHPGVASLISDKRGKKLHFGERRLHHAHFGRLRFSTWLGEN